MLCDLRGFILGESHSLSMDYSLVGHGIAAGLCLECIDLVQLYLGIDTMEEALELSLAYFEEKTGRIEWDDEALCEHPEYHTWVEPSIHLQPCDLGCEGDGKQHGQRYICHGWRKENGKDILDHLYVCDSCLVEWCG